ncbi:sensor histidine kinase [Streptomyces sp. ME19-01-6]|uniref:sensor histidine kinase n=1 Tax=Streptomyces sp. ME19-01-6 TaxID=3028686 RepID=UPI0029AAE2CB|nr:histidine kinase [Streptomyces sp. ME19-01-6]MDX3232005.1 histidine kinase [Streptomyces sp. ME19-01-6]
MADVSTSPTALTARIPRAARTALAPLTRAVTYTRWLHLLMGAVVAAACGLVYPGLFDLRPADLLWLPVLPVLPLVAVAMVPATRLAEGLQARLLLTPGEHARHQQGHLAPRIAAAPSASRGDRGRTALWLVLRLEAGCLTALLSVQLPALTGALITAVSHGTPTVVMGVRISGHHWWYALLAPLPLAALMALVVAAGSLMTAAATRLLGPSAAERLAALEERTERLLEHNRLARELHDSIGHALTVAVVQAGAARAAGSREFTDRALTAIEETGRHALEDLERVLRLLREDTARGPADRPGLTDAERLLESARAAGSTLDAEVTGPLEELPGPVSREGYRILQEALTNVLRHAGPVPVAVRVAVAADTGALRLDVRNPLPGHERPDGTFAGPGRGTGLRGIRERAALLGGEAEAGPYEGEWRLSVTLPPDRGHARR